MAESTMSPAFAQTPMNPNLAAMGAEGSAPAAAPATPPVEQPSGLFSEMVTQPQTPPQVSDTPAPEQPAQPFGAPAASPQVSEPAPAPSYPSWEEYARLQAQAQAVAQQNAQLQQQMTDRDATINNLLQLQQEYDALRNKVSAANIDYGELATVDAEDARRIGAGVLKAVADQLAPLQQALAQQQQAMQQQATQQERNNTALALRNTLERVKAVHPDFEALQTDPGFVRFLQQKDGLSSYTLDDRAKQEFLRGNSAYINQLVAQYKAQKPNTSAITSVAPVQTANTPVQPAVNGGALPTLHELNSMMQMRQITADQYRDYLAKIRAAQRNLQG